MRGGDLQDEQAELEEPGGGGRARKVGLTWEHMWATGCLATLGRQHFCLLQDRAGQGKREISHFWPELHRARASTGYRPPLSTCIGSLLPLQTQKSLLQATAAEQKGTQGSLRSSTGSV